MKIFPFKTALLLVSILFLAGIQGVYATHNRAGEITYVQIGELAIRVTITTYTQTSSVQADRDSLELFWGDGTSTVIPRANGDGDRLPNDIKRNFYIAEHVYPGRATYTLGMMDPNRNGGILNVNAPNSIKVPFYIETTFTFLSSQFQGQNSSAVLLQPPIDFGCLRQRFIHNPNAYDPDGDSLSYELIVPLQDKDMVVPNYRFLDQIKPGDNNKLSLDPVTGDLIWDSPQQPGEYNVAFKIHEYRQGVLINSIIRDMQIEIRDCENQPPQIETIEELCVIAGEEVMLPVRATDPDNGQLLSVTALGGPLEVVVSPAEFSINGNFREQPVEAFLRWQTQCEHISNQPYTVVFKAVDNFFDTTGLADLKTVRIKVVGPPPENLTVENLEPSNRISWDSPYSCEVTENEFFQGFIVWRRPTSNQFLIDTCSPGLQGRGYTAVAFSVKSRENDRYFYVDNDVGVGESFCYRVTAGFAQISPVGGYAYNSVESLPSNEDCAGFASDVPFITEVSVEGTDAADGAISVEWTKPTDEVFASVPGPFTFTLLRRESGMSGGLTPVPGGTFSASSLIELNDTSFIDVGGLNTLASGYQYQVRMTAGNNLSVQSEIASSVFLNVEGADQRNILTWSFSVPWENYFYRIYRRDDQGSFVQIGTSDAASFTDNNLENGQSYCYYVETEGTYGFSGIRSPLINLSQVSCGTPNDTDPPCKPELTVQNSCDSDNASATSAFINTLSWSLPSSICEKPSDVSGYRIYYAPTKESEFEQLDQIDDPTSTSFQHGSEFGIAGCYYVTALDSLANESDSSNNICVENCPFYALPNTFTPNGDGANDLFKPFPYKFIDRIDMVIYNRWGQVVYETADPEINWNGQNFAGNDLSQGVYHYTCRVFESRAQGTVESGELLTGYIELIR